MYLQPYDHIRVRCPVAFKNIYKGPYLKNMQSTVCTTPRNSRHAWITRNFGMKVRTSVSVMLSRISRVLFIPVVSPSQAANALLSTTSDYPVLGFLASNPDPSLANCQEPQADKTIGAEAFPAFQLHKAHGYISHRRLLILGIYE
jgi:hypothetical protein